MPKTQKKESVSIKAIERLLSQQVREIEQRIDKKVEDRLSRQTIIILSAVDEKLKKTEISIKMKKVIKEKLGVDLS